MICFVVLHYQNIDVTNRCIRYLLALSDSDKMHIIIVDNGSPNKSGLEIQKKYSNNPLITVLLSKQNLGFARGNNLGYSYAREKMNANCIVVMNSDIYITDKEFNYKIQTIIDKYDSIAIMAPDVINRQGIHCNPMIVPPIDSKEIRKIYRKNFVRYVAYSIPQLNKVLWLRNQNQSAPMKRNRENWDKDQKNIVPDGSCIIYTSNWIEKEEFAFVPITFMYAEEHILYEYLKVHGYESMYVPDLKVCHMEGATTGSLASINIVQGIKNKKRNLKWHMDSCKTYLAYKNKLNERE